MHFFIIFFFFIYFRPGKFIFFFSIFNLLCGFLVIPFFVEYNIDPRRLKLDCRTMFMAFFGGNGGGDGSFSCSIGLCLPQRPIIIVRFSNYVYFVNEFFESVNFIWKKKKNNVFFVNKFFSSDFLTQKSWWSWEINLKFIFEFRTLKMNVFFNNKNKLSLTY